MKWSIVKNTSLTFSLISSFSNFLTSSRLVRYFKLTALAAMLGHLGAISLKNLTKRKEVRKLEKELIRPIICHIMHLALLWIRDYRHSFANTMFVVAKNCVKRNMYHASQSILVFG